MQTLQKYFASEIVSAVLFTLIAFLALFAFFDLMSELSSVGHGGYKLQHAFLYVLMGLPGYTYELMPIAVLIGTIRVMANFASTSEFTIMRVFGQWQIGADVPQDALTQLMACNELTLSLKVVKVGIANETLVVTGEHVVGADTDVRGLLMVTTQLALSAVHMWHERVMGRTHDDDAGVEQA